MSSVDFTYSSTGVAKHATVMVCMSDGIRLATEIFVPLKTGVRGTIVERTPYGRRPILNTSVLMDSYYRSVEHLCLNGYSVMIQDCRGTGDSQGEFVKYVNEAGDGVDTLAWGARQEWWGDGGYLTGRSYSAHAALAAVVAGATEVRGMFLDCGGFWSAYHEGIRQGGAFELKQVTWAFEAASRNCRESGLIRVQEALEQQKLSAWIRPVPWQHGQSPLRFSKEHEGALLDLWDQEMYGDYWSQPSLSARGQSAKMGPFPSLHVSGWYDLYTLSTVQLFIEMGARAGADTYIILGPWTHCAVEEPVAGDVDFGPTATVEGATGMDYLAMRTQWFNYCLDTREPFGPRVRFFLMGGGTGNRVRGRLDHGGIWLSSNEWPPSEVRPMMLRLGDRGDLIQDHGEVRAPANLEYEYDPDHPVPTIGGSVGSYSGILAPGAFDQREDPRFFGCAEPFMPLLARSDVLAFTTTVLEADVALVGSAVLELDFSTEAEDTDITVKLIDYYPPSDQYPEGFAMNICDTVLRLRCQPKLIPIRDGPISLYHVVINLPPTANRFVAGHSIRLDVSSSNFPRFDTNSNTRSSGPRGRRRVKARSSVRVGGERGAVFTMPTLDVTDWVSRT